MKNVEKATIKGTLAIGKQRSYNEIVEFLDNNWTTNSADIQLTCIKKLDLIYENISKKVPTIIVGGTSGKSLTINFTTKLLKEEGLKVGTFYAPHLLTYNERFAINNETITNKAFTELANDVINVAETEGLTANTFELLTIMALLYFSQHKVDVALLETHYGTYTDAVTICDPKIAAITRIVSEVSSPLETQQNIIRETLSIVKAGTHVISADQSKINLQTMHTLVTEKGGKFEMPIRKLAPLGYPFEQLHGRCAALAERIADIFINNFINTNATVTTGTLLVKPKGQRGRPTLEAKRRAELNPRQTIDQFWRETQNSLTGHFQLLDKEKPSLLLDNASNLDALKNLLLGVRLLHYQRPLKGLTLILGCNNPDIDVNELLKLLRYFFKKTSGQVIVCPVDVIPGHKGSPTWDIEKITNNIKGMKIKAKSSKNFKTAFEIAQKSVDDRHGLVVITGSSSIITEYWRYKGIKKF